VSTRTSVRTAPVLPGVLLMLGSLLFTAGGRHHPRIDESIGALGSEEFYRAFVGEILRVPNWESMHVLILVGPVLWALGVAGLGRDANGAGSGMPQIAGTALAIAAVAWMVVFVLDGFAAPVIARGLAAAPTEGAASMMVSFKANQAIVIRLGLFSWMLVGIAAALLSIDMILRARTRMAPLLLGAIGVLVGGWPMIAWARGEFVPGPFTSPLWKTTALATALWYAALGVMALLSHRDVEEAIGHVARSRRDATASPQPLTLP
jgi:hypothetical protein